MILVSSYVRGRDHVGIEQYYIYYGQSGLDVVPKVGLVVDK